MSNGNCVLFDLAQVVANLKVSRKKKKCMKRICPSKTLGFKSCHGQNLDGQSLDRLLLSKWDLL
jgi:hypothetical protein